MYLWYYVNTINIKEGGNIMAKILVSAVFICLSVIFLTCGILFISSEEDKEPDTIFSISSKAKKRIAIIMFVLAAIVGVITFLIRF